MHCSTLSDQMVVIVEVIVLVIELLIVRNLLTSKTIYRICVSARTRPKESRRNHHRYHIHHYLLPNRVAG